ncbi:MAG TPA: biopolymer transporter ExbD [Myxococcaceae bacterium]|jgi:biopolymer transport protein ExbD|nr:biopolymer transporter ExbD [Myxococcaceae bacterium]
MALGKVPGSEADDADGVFSDINITPLTDIFLVLLIIFMVTSSVIVNQGQGAAKAGLKVNLPKGSAADVTPAATDLSVAVLADGRLVLSGDVVTADELRKALDAARQKNSSTLVVIQADEGVPHGKVVEVMEMAKTAGLAQLAIGVREAPPAK